MAEKREGGGEGGELSGRGRQSRERQERGGIEGKDTVEKREGGGGGGGGRTKAGGERQTDTQQGGARWRRHRGERDR